MRESSDLDRTIARLAERQHGHVARRQLLALGMGSATIGDWLARGRLVRVHAGVYAVGYRRVEPVARAAAARLAAGDGAVLSHASALALWGLAPWPREVELIAPHDVRRRGIRAHRSTTLTRAETTTELGVRTTTVARTLRDMRRRLSRRAFDRAVNRARLDGHLSWSAADELMGGRASRHPTRSAGEDDLLAWLRLHDMPEAVMNVRAPLDHEVDVLFPGHGVIVELDDPATHGDLATFESDRERDRAHLAAGLVTVRLVRGRLTEVEAERLRVILAARGPMGGAPS